MEAANPRSNKQSEIKRALENKLIISEERLSQMKEHLFKYIYLKAYRESIGKPLPSEILKKIAAYRPLFKEVYKITPLHYKQLLQDLPTIYEEDVLGQTPKERIDAIVSLLSNVKQNIEVMEQLGCSPQELNHSYILRDNLLYAKRTSMVPLPKVQEFTVERTISQEEVANRKINDKIIRVSIDSIEGSVLAGRKFYIKLSFNNRGLIDQRVSPMVGQTGSCRSSQVCFLSA